MFARCARVEPAVMRACSLPRYFTDSFLSCCSIDTPVPIGMVSVPLAPLTVTAPAATLTVTPLGRSMIRLATLDISAHLDQCACASGDDAQDFPALADRVRRLVGHHALGRGHDHGPHTAQHARNLVLAAIDTQPGPAHALDAVDHRAAVVVLQVNRQHRLAVILVEAEVGDITLVLEHLQDRRLQLRRGDGDAGFTRGLAVSDTGQQVGDRIGHAHRYSSYQLALPSPGISPRIATSRIFTRASPNLRYTPRERPVIAQRERWRLLDASRGCCCRATCAAARCSGLDLGLRMSSSPPRL